MNVVEIPHGDWVTQVTLATRLPVGEELFDEFADRADKLAATVALRVDAPGAVFTFHGQDPGEAFRLAIGIVQIVGGYDCAEWDPLVELRVVTPEAYEADAARPDTPELMAASDVAVLLGISRQRVHQLAADRADFPAPYARAGTGPVWTRPTIEHFARNWERKPGRPARKAG